MHDTNAVASGHASDGLSDADFEDVADTASNAEYTYASIYGAASADSPAAQDEGGVEVHAAPRIQVTIAAPPRKQRTGPTPRDRQNRVLCHKLHVLSILAAARVRNRWCNNVDLRQKLQDAVPTFIINKIHAIHPRLEPERRERVRMFEAVMHELVDWWSRTYFLDQDICSAAAWRQPCMDILAGAQFAPRTRVDGWVVESAGARAARRSKRMEIAIFPPGDGVDVPTYLRLAPPAESCSPRDLLRLADDRVVSRETSAVLFCATCRALGIPARLVVSVQAPSWSSSGATKRQTEPAAESSDASDAPPVRLRSSRAASADARAAVCPHVDLSAPPTVWVEVFSKPFQRWITVDPVRSLVRATGARGMEPIAADRTNKLLYIMAFEEDGYARDVTARYTRTLNTRVARLRMHGRDSEWWPRVVRALHRPQKLDRDAVEDAELADNVGKEPMPTSVAAFKDHPVYALERHLRRDQVIHPAVRIGTFQGTAVYSRANVINVHSARQWYNEGREVKPNEIPLKWVKARTYTLTSKRIEEQAKADGTESQEPLYSYDQTALYVAPPVRNGVVPRNAFGHIDLFVPSMLPAGGAHIPYNGAAKIAKKLNVDYAEATVGFEFRRFASIPRMQGIVVPKEHEKAILAGYWEAEKEAAEAERIKREERAFGHWKRFIVALTVARRLYEQYGGKPLEPVKAQPEVRQLQDKQELLQPPQDEVRQLRDIPEDHVVEPPVADEELRAIPACSSPPTAADTSRIIPLEEFIGEQAPKRRRIVLRRKQ
ncbi:hypothetical protein MCUN1_001096 [Malassezia cuniculi]|uniref:Rad4-domain-containing protein n=1 Tax=Malassezia cuniculi TaxID=948313 RepID=A0AAF0J687_9BASI|nr:hypothetical protein MCUN1_001096 [Malassezia cuniculi]